MANDIIAPGKLLSHFLGLALLFRTLLWCTDKIDQLYYVLPHGCRQEEVHVVRRVDLTENVY